ncbi:MAG: queuosine salvage family protein, partial [Leptonema sp. (in: bacteria)]
SISLKKLFENYKEIINFDFLKNLSFSEFKKFLNGTPLGEERFKILKEVSEFVVKKYAEPVKFVLSAQQSAKILLKKIYKEIPYFDDIAFYQNRKIYFLKRAQILIADIYGAFGGKGIGHFKDIDYLTCFADYKLPKILNHYGILEYSKDLKNKIKKKELILAKSHEEIEIRANTIWAVEFLKEELKRLGRNLKSLEIDWY